MKKIILGVVVFMQSCTVNKDLHKSFVGKWCLNDKTQLNYPVINFGTDSIAVFSSKMDTVYSFKYYKKENYLHLVQPTGNVIKEKILYLSKDSLVFKSLMENKAPQKYTKCN